MKRQTIKFFGSDADLKELRQRLSKNGFEDARDDVVRAADATSGSIIPAAIAFTVAVSPFFVSCIQTYLKECSKRVVTRDEKKLTVRGNFSAKEFGDIVERCYRLDIEDEKDDA